MAYELMGCDKSAATALVARNTIAMDTTIEKKVPVAQCKSSKKKSSKKWKKVLRYGSMVVGFAGVAILATPVVVTAIGFGAGGIVGGSTAASMMSVLGGGATQAGSIVAICQSIGATGTVFGPGVATAATATVRGAAVVFNATRDTDNDEVSDEESNDE